MGIDKTQKILTSGFFITSVTKIKKIQKQSLPYVTKKPSGEGFFECSGGRIRTYDLRVMSPTSYQTAPPRVSFKNVP